MTSDKRYATFLVMTAIAALFVLTHDVLARPGGGGMGGRGGGGGGFSRGSGRGGGFSHGGRSGFSRSGMGRSNYGSIRHSNTFYGGPGRESCGPGSRMVGSAERERIATSSRALKVSGHHNGIAYYQDLPPGYVRLRRDNRYYYKYDDVLYRRMRHDGRYVYVAADDLP